VTADAEDQRQDDLQLARRAASGDRSAFHAIIERVSPMLLRSARGLCRSQADAEDVVQETLIESYKSLRTYDGKARLLTWMTRILIRRANRAWTKSRKRPSHVSLDTSEMPSGDDTAMVARESVGDVDRRLDVAAVLAELSTEHREVLVLRELQGLSYGEIAAVL
jgi:RNA polymerase sigma-70 factor (ECF subfamily)